MLIDKSLSLYCSANLLELTPLISCKMPSTDKIVSKSQSGFLANNVSSYYYCGKKRA